MEKRSSSFLLARVRVLTAFFILALIVSGLTAVPLRQEMDLLVRWFAQAAPPTALGSWLLQVQTAVAAVDEQWPFLALGTDWLAFGHVVIGLGFIGLWRDPVRNDWLITWGILACLLVLPWAWGFGLARHIPWGWRLIDCSFGLGGLVPMLLIRRDVLELSRRVAARGGLGLR